MIPPSDRQNIKQNNLANLSADFSAIKELDSLSNEIVELQKVETARWRSGWGSEYRVYPLCPWWLNTRVCCAGPPGREITVEEEIKEKEDAIRQRNNEVQDLEYERVPCLPFLNYADIKSV
ncbi:hypothetical protein KUCAC02_031916 [Chaenocephalus aceratus]|nr:hypothetical protein KUCAC02_031916 [Chaenocephalus aceratus]